MKNKKLAVALIAGTAAVALGSVGFATWIVGVQQMTTTGQIAVVVDDTKNNNIRIEQVAPTDAIVIAETAATTGENNIVVVDGSAQNQGTDLGIDANAFTFKFPTLKIHVGKDVATKPTKVRVALDVQETEDHKMVQVSTANVAASSACLIKTSAGDAIHTGENLTYLALNQVVSIGEYTEQKINPANAYEYLMDLSATTFKFELGTYFGGKAYNVETSATATPSVAAYYNNIFRTAVGAASSDTDFEYLNKQADNISHELEAMKAALAGNDVKLTVRLSLE